MDKDAKSILNLLQKLSESNDDDKPDKNISIDGQKELFYEALAYQENVKKMKVGDYVRCNKLGKQRYRYPRDNQVAMIIKKYDPAQLYLKENTEDDCISGEVAIIIKNRTVFMNVDLRYYEIDKEHSTSKGSH